MLSYIYLAEDMIAVDWRPTWKFINGKSGPPRYPAPDPVSVFHNATVLLYPSSKNHEADH